MSFSPKGARTKDFIATTANITREDAVSLLMGSGKEEVIYPCESGGYNSILKSEACVNDMRHGDTITISGVFEPRTFWEFITMKPRKLKQYKAKSMTVAGVGLECH